MLLQRLTLRYYYLLILVLLASALLALLWKIALLIVMQGYVTSILVIFGSYSMFPGH